MKIDEPVSKQSLLNYRFKGTWGWGNFCSRERLFQSAAPLYLNMYNNCFY